MSRIDIIAEVLVQEIETLKTTVKEVKELQQKGVEINQKPLDSFMMNFNESMRNLEHLNKVVNNQQKTILGMVILLVVLSLTLGAFICKFGLIW